MNQAAAAPARASRPLRLSSVSRDALAVRNVLCRRRAAVEATWLGRSWKFRLAAHAPATPCEWYVSCDWGGATVVVGLAPSACASFTSELLGAAQRADWPADIVRACVEQALGELVGTIEAATRKHVQVTNISRERPPVDQPECRSWSARSDEAEIEGELLLDPTAARFLAGVAREQPLHPDDAAWEALRLRLNLLVGWVDLPRHAFTSIGVRDVLVLDECLLSTRNELVLMLASSIGLRCDLSGPELRVLEGVQEIMSDPEDYNEAAAGLLDDVPVRLTFDLGDREVTFAELRSIQAGYVFNLGRDPRSSVTIRANGRVVGEGELVDVEGRVGVSVLRLSAAVDRDHG